MVAPRNIVVGVKPAAWLQQDGAGPEWTDEAHDARGELRNGAVTGGLRDLYTEALTEAETDQYKLIELYGEALANEVRAAAHAVGWSGSVEVIIWTADGEDVPGTTSTRATVAPHHCRFVEDELAAAARRALVVDRHKGAWRIRRKATGEAVSEL